MSSICVGVHSCARRRGPFRETADVERKCGYAEAERERERAGAARHGYKTARASKLSLRTSIHPPPPLACSPPLAQRTHHELSEGLEEEGASDRAVMAGSGRRRAGVAAALLLVLAGAVALCGGVAMDAHR
jgi:hypothetical protein